MTAGVLLLCLAGGPLYQPPAAPAEYPSVHMEAMREFGGNSPCPVETRSTGGNRDLHGTVFGFLPYWVNQAWLQYDLLSVLAVFSLDMGPGGTITSYHGYPGVFQTAMDQAQGEGVTVVFTVTNFSGSSIHSILTTGKATAISTIENLVNTTSAEGVCIDFENVQGSDAANLVLFMEELREALPQAHISICTPVVDWSGAFNYSELAETTDALMMMCYAFAGSWSNVAGPNAPLTGWGYSPESSANMAWALCDYVRYAPEVHEKLVVGLPYYGHQWETESQYTHSPGTNCSTLFYTTLAARADTYGRLWDTESLTPWYAFQSGGWNQGWYDDTESLGLKYDIVRMAGFQGVGIWALGYDGDLPELWDLLGETFTLPLENDMITDNLEDCFTLHGPASYWHPYTEGGQYHTFFYTGSISGGPDINWAAWNFHLPDSSGSYFLEAYVPPTGEAEVTYRILHGAGEDTVTVDQAVFSQQWVDLGGPYPASGGLEVRLGDFTGTSGERIVADAVRFTGFTGTDETVEGGVQSGITVSPGPAPFFTVMSPTGGSFFAADLAGRVLCRRELSPGEGFLWNEGNPPGVYFLSVENGGELYSRRVVLIR